MSCLIRCNGPVIFIRSHLPDDAGQIITLNNKNYTFTAIRPAKTEAMLRTLMCDDSTTLRLYAGGYHGLDDVHELDIMNTSTKEKMVFNFHHPCLAEQINFTAIFLQEISF